MEQVYVALPLIENPIEQETLAKDPTSFINGTVMIPKLITGGSPQVT